MGQSAFACFDVYAPGPRTTDDAVSGRCSIDTRRPWPAAPVSPGAL